MRSRAWLLALVPTLLSACALRGPAFTGSARLEYNEAVQQSGRRELLLNLVRLRYLESPEFLSVGSIASQMRFDVGASVGGAFGDDQSLPTRLVAPGGDFAYSESPVATFTPRQDETFTRRLVEPIELDHFLGLTRYGWSFERALLVAVEQLNGVRNVATREPVRPEDVAAGERFAALARSMQALYEQRWLTLEVVDEWAGVGGDIPAAAVAADDHVRAAELGYRLEPVAARSVYELKRPSRRFVLRVAPEAQASSEVNALLSMLDVPPGQREYELTDRAAAERPAGAIAVRTRSVMGAMAYLSQGVAIPVEDAVTGRAPPSVPLAGVVPLRVATALEEPVSAALAVRSGERWFYIEAGDFESRRTFGALESLLRLQVGAGGAVEGPVLTLPVAR